MTFPSMMTTMEVAEALGYETPGAIHKRIDRGDLKLAACRLSVRSHRCWSRQRLIAAGFMTAPMASIAPPSEMGGSAVLTASAVVATWRVA